MKALEQRILRELAKNPCDPRELLLQARSWRVPEAAIQEAILALMLEREAIEFTPDRKLKLSREVAATPETRAAA